MESEKWPPEPRLNPSARIMILDAGPVQPRRWNVFAGRRDVGGKTEKPCNTVAALVQH